MKMFIERKPKTVDVTLTEDPDRGDIDIRVNGIQVAYFTLGIGTPTLRVSRANLRQVGFMGLEVTEV